MQTGSVTHAAEVIGRTPPSVSTSLSQLREILEDPLFIRVGNQLQPTAKAAQLIEPVEAAVRQISKIFEAQQFNPDVTERVFVIAATDSLVVSVGSRIVQELRKQAPNVSIQFLALDEGIAEAMATRAVDFAFLPEIALESLSPVPLSYQELGTVKFDSVLMSSDHALSDRTNLTADDIIDLPQVGFRPNAYLAKYVSEHPMMQVNASVTASHNLAIPSLVENSDLIAIVTTDIAKREAAGRNLVSIPLASSMELPFGLVWSSVLDRDGAHQWLRKLIFDVVCD